MSGLRYENKFVVPRWRVPMLVVWLSARLGADPEHADGHVRTVYFDTVDRRFLGQKANSDFAKQKARLRWYATSERASASGSAWLEVKSKTGALGSKRRIELPGLAEIADRQPDDIDLDTLHLAGLRNGLRLPPVRPLLALHYHRRRWIDPASASRVSVDTDIRPTWAPGIGPFHPFAEPLDVAVCEVKGGARVLPASLVGLGRFEARRAAFSKYYECLGQLRYV